ncbi:MAG TPA: amino acid ABC transporter permease [Terriglobales bacterium]|nr:amino acid ABC transporter permease [Terriglobales bacterium]
MTDIADPRRSRGDSAATPWWRDERWRGIFAQVVTVLIIILVLGFLITNMIVNREAQGRPFSYDFMENIAGFPVAMSLIHLDLNSTITRVMVAGMLNTALAGVISIILSTIVGFVIGIARLSPNYLVARLAAAYIEVFRNIPLLVQLSFWYFGVLKLMPQQKDSINLFNGAFLNVRGLYLPAPILESGFLAVFIALIVGIVATIVVRRWATRRQAATGQQFHKFWASLALIIGLPLIVWLLVRLAGGEVVNWEYPSLQGFNFQGGFVILPELNALVIGLSMYTAAYIAEIVRGGIQAVSHGQTEAASALGLRRSWTLRLVIVPQALRIIVPPLTSQYLNVVKNSTLAVFVGFPDFVSLFTGTVLNQTGREVEVVAITMVFYLAISLVISLFMNWYNKHISLVER